MMPRSTVGRVEWNVTGYVVQSTSTDEAVGQADTHLLSGRSRTILSSAGNDGRVRLWKMTAGNVWRPAGHISVEQAEEQQGDVDMGETAVED